VRDNRYFFILSNIKNSDDQMKKISSLSLTFENPSEHRQSQIFLNFFLFTLAEFYEPPVCKHCRKCKGKISNKWRNHKWKCKKNWLKGGKLRIKIKERKRDEGIFFSCKSSFSLRSRFHPDFGLAMFEGLLQNND